MPQGLKATLKMYIIVSGLKPRPTIRNYCHPHLPFKLCWHWINPLQKSCMNESPIHETAFPGIGRNIRELFLKILHIANPMLMKSYLPHFPSELRPHLMRESALDALGATFNCLVLRRCQQHMDMLRHDGKPMQSVPSLIPIMKEHLDQQLGIFYSDKESAPLVRRRRERIGFHGRLREHIPGNKFSQ
jgi:hypothetical protein